MRIRKSVRGLATSAEGGSCNRKSPENEPFFFYNKTKVKLGLQRYEVATKNQTEDRFSKDDQTICLPLQTGSFWQCSGFSCAGVRAGVRYSDRHRTGHRVPRLPSGDPLGSVVVDASPGAGGSFCR